MTQSSTVREFTERILLTDSLEEKLTHAPDGMEIDPPARGGYHAPTLPGRPEELIPRKHLAKSAFPSIPQLEHEEHRATLLHFFANHELLAVELMALALLKFPDAPDAFRRGVFRTLREEQSHTRWYLKRMEQCGVTFGELPVSPMIWEHLAQMESPLDYVSGLSLTFEQANLDYARHYSRVMAQAGDHQSAKILEKIYHDEIAHVGHGIKWLRRWKEQALSDWDAWHQQLHFPLSPIRAKGMAPFNAEGRRQAGINEEFIASLQRFQSSRGRSPDLWFFNPDAEAEAASPSWTCPRRLEELAADLELAFILAGPTTDDLALVRRFPSDAHRDALARRGLLLPELALLADRPQVLRKRKIRHHCPWAEVSPTLSKERTQELRERLPEDLRPLPSGVFEKSEIATFIARHPFTEWIAKDLYGAAGRGLHRFQKENVSTLPAGRYLIEPWVSKVHQLSLLFHRRPPEEGGLRFLGTVRQETDSRGQWVASRAMTKPATGLPAPIAQHLSQDLSGQVRRDLLPAIEQLLASRNFTGPVCLDSFYYQQDGEIHWQPVVEMNARWTMGRIAYELKRKLSPTTSLNLTTMKPADAQSLSQDSDAILLGDPEAAHTRVPVALLRVLIFLFAFLALPEARADKTNVVLILVDDAGYGDFSCYGQQHFQTPHIDKLARGGMRFTRHYSGSTVCAPTRSVLMTGQHTGHTPIRGNGDVKDDQGNRLGQNPLPAEAITMAEIFQSAGYATGAFGKWGLGYPGSEGDPLKQGFDRFFGYNCQWNAHTYFPTWLYDNDRRITLDGQTYTPPLIQEKAMAWLDEVAEKPFFLFLPVTLPHAAMHTPEELAAPFRKDFPQFEKVEARYGDNPPHTTNPAAQFAAMMKVIDDQVGELVAKLDQLQLTEETLILFTSDNGPHLEGGHQPNFFDSNGPFRGHKRDFYEGGIRVPLIAHWPGKTKPSTVTDHPCTHWDLLPTLCEAVGLTPPPKQDGLSFFPLLTGKPQKMASHFYWEFASRGGRRAAIFGPRLQWKAIQYNMSKDKNAPIELYNLEEDAGERHDRARDFPNLVDQVRDLFDKSRTHNPRFSFSWESASR